MIKANHAGRIVVLGTGFVAQAYMRALCHLGYFPIIFSRAWIDYTDPKVLHTELANSGCGFVINAAGYTGVTVDDCEQNRHECYHANTTLPVMVANTCAALSIPLIHVSSGCIFNGAGPFLEDDRPQQMTGLQSFYAVCKQNAEDGIIRAGGRVFIFRIRMPFTHLPHPRNWLMKLANYPLILDGLNSATWIDEFSMRSWQLAEKAPPGIYHCVQPEPIRTVEVAQMLGDAGLRKLAVECWNPDDFAKQHCKRSAAVLDCGKFESSYKFASTPMRSAIEWCIEQLAAKK